MHVQDVQLKAAKRAQRQKHLPLLFAIPMFSLFIQQLLISILIFIYRSVVYGVPRPLEDGDASHKWLPCWFFKKGSCTIVRFLFLALALFGFVFAHQGKD